MLAGTKVPFTPSVLLAVLPLLAGAALLIPRNFPGRRYVVPSVVFLFLASVLLTRILSPTPGGERQANCFHFVFSGALSFLSPDAGKDYLHKLGLDPGLTSLAGKNAYEADSLSSTVWPALTPRFHVKSAARLAFDYPSIFFKMIGFSFSKAGLYPRLQYPSLSDPHRVKFRFKWRFWSRLHHRFLHGTAYYGVVLFLTCLLGILIWRRKDSGWPLFYFLGAAGFFPASLLQVIISVVGNGPIDIVKHQYFANLLLDAAFVFVCCGLTITGITLWKRRRGTDE